MVQTDVSQLTAECSDWRQVLRNHRETLNQSKKNLEALCRSQLSKVQLQNVEHFHNQFHIQLINIHDLKQAIKAHERRLQFENHENLTEETLAEHEALYEQFTNMETTLQDVNSEFQHFSKNIH